VQPEHEKITRNPLNRLCPETTPGRPRIAAFRSRLQAETARGDDTIPADRQTATAGGRILIDA